MDEVRSGRSMSAVMLTNYSKSNVGASELVRIWSAGIWGFQEGILSPGWCSTERTAQRLSASKIVHVDGYKYKVPTAFSLMGKYLQAHAYHYLQPSGAGEP